MQVVERGILQDVYRGSEGTEEGGMILSGDERKALYKALAIVERVVIGNVELWAQRLFDYKIRVESDGDEAKIVVDEVPKSMTMLQALYLAKKLIAAVLNADEMKKLKKWLKE